MVIGAGCCVTVYPLLLWFFMTRPNVFWAFNGGSPALHGEVEFAPHTVSVSANPYACRT